MVTKIEQKIISQKIMTDVTSQPKPVILSNKLPATRYKIKPPYSDDAIYVHISDAEINGELRPVEIFITSKAMESFQWITLVTRLTSALLRTPGPFPKFILEEYQCIHDPKGGYVVPGSQGTWVPSAVAHIGLILKEHYAGLQGTPEEALKELVEEKIRATEQPPMPQCPKCKEYALRMVEGCETCTKCGYSKCG